MNEENLLQKIVSEEFKKYKDGLDDILWGELHNSVILRILPLQNNLYSILKTDNLESLMKKIKENKP